MKKKRAPEWLRWLYLVMVFFIPFAAWMDFRNYPHYYELGIFSEERWVEVMEGFHFRWAVQGLMAACFLFQFIILTWDKMETGMLFWRTIPPVQPCCCSGPYCPC